MLNLTKRGEIMVGTTILNLQCLNNVMTLSSGKSRAVGNIHVFVACQIDVFNK